MTYRDPKDLADKQSGLLERFVRGMIRRVSVTLTTGSLWQTLGYKGGALAQGGDETTNYEPFTGIGFYSTPPASGTPHAIVAAYGSTKTAALVAFRDETTRKVGAGDLAQGETCVYNDKARIIVKQDGTVEIRLHGGVAIALPTMADFNGIISIMNSAGTGSSTALPAAVAAYQAANPTWPVGTTQLKAQ